MIAALDAAYAGARTLLDGYLATPFEARGAAIAKLRPRPPDYRVVFDPEHAAAEAERGYVHLWGNAPVWPVPPEPAIVLHCAPSDAFEANSREAQAFPGGYREIACWLKKGVVWVAWTITSRGRAAGAMFDGLVEVEPGRWAWFPRPWKALPKPLAPTLWWDD